MIDNALSIGGKPREMLSPLDYGHAEFCLEIAFRSQQ
jgi:hypothetical protein